VPPSALTESASALTASAINGFVARVSAYGRAHFAIGSPATALRFGNPSTTSLSFWARRQATVEVGATTPGVAALLRETSTIAIVFMQVADPLGQGFIANLARPGGNITGFTSFEFSRTQ
jgi:hypothetical protein